MRILVTGSKGQLGTDVCSELRRAGHSVIEADLPETDILSFISLHGLFEESHPEAVVHLAAYTAVDAAETDKEKCYRLNVTGTENIAKLCREFDIPVLYTSTDYIFGNNGSDYLETDAEPCPKSVYGLTKYLGELAIQKHLSKYFIVRISWVFGPNGKNFVYTMLRLAETRDTINVVDDQIGSPTYTPDLSKLICNMIATEKYGVYHATNEGVCSWAEFASEIMKVSGSKAKINPIPSSEYPSAAARPFNSRLSKKSLDENGFSRLPEWKDALSRFIEKVK